MDAPRRVHDPRREPDVLRKPISVGRAEVNLWKSQPDPLPRFQTAHQVRLRSGSRGEILVEQVEKD
jgi:hypothetical protein